MRLPGSEVGADLEIAASLGFNFLDCDALGDVDEGEAAAVLAVNVKDGEFCDDLADGPGASQGKRTLLEDLGAAIARAVFHGHNNLRLVWVGYEIHGTADTLKAR